MGANRRLCFCHRAERGHGSKKPADRSFLAQHARTCTELMTIALLALLRYYVLSADPT